MGTSSFVHAAAAVGSVTDNYLYESLIQAEFDIEHQVHTSVGLSSTEAFQQVLMAANSFGDENVENTLTASVQIEQSQVEKGIAE